MWRGSLEGVAKLSSTVGNVAQTLFQAHVTTGHQTRRLGFGPLLDNRTVPASIRID